MTEPETKAPDGTVRKAHYGVGRLPWDVIVDLGFAPEFAAGNALKYVRRHAAKNGEDDIEKGRWYYERLTEMARGERSLPSNPWRARAAKSRAARLLKVLATELTEVESALLK